MAHRYLLVVLAASWTVGVGAQESAVYPKSEWRAVEPESLGMRAERLNAARDYALTGGGAGMITRRGQVVTSWGETKRKFDLKSTSKSIGVTSLGLAIDDRKMQLTLYFSEAWDVGPGETSSIPTKWISDDGRAFHLVFSGEDAFSVRRAVMVMPSR